MNKGKLAGVNGEAQDCLGVCGGSAQEDECGVCGGDNSSCAPVVLSIENVTGSRGNLDIYMTNTEAVEIGRAHV